MRGEVPSPLAEREERLSSPPVNNFGTPIRAGAVSNLNPP
jgi:hypothetical protein